MDEIKVTGVMKETLIIQRRDSSITRPSGDVLLPYTVVAAILIGLLIVTHK